MNALTQPQFQDAEIAREHLEQMRWPDGPVCVHCSGKNVYKLTAKEGSKKPVRKGVYKCAECREQFTVTIGTIFEDSKIPLNKWLLAIHLLCASKKGMSAHQLHRMLGVGYKTAWFMAHRIRYAMSQPPYTEKLRGAVEADETYVGGRQKGGFGRIINKNKRPVFSIVKRGGDVRSFHVERVTAETLGGIIKKHVHSTSRLNTDEFAAYKSVGDMFAVHHTVNHGRGEYVRGTASTNTVEGFFSLLKRGLNGTYHHVDETHLHRYLSEFDFRYNNRKIKDDERAAKALAGTVGKRLTLREPSSGTTPPESAAS
jgi:transposase-like protein